ncbi:MAG: diguanylate cyclase, partial [Gammaproteobacteria bacterium]|nr:diguanylate cyclase [Gammaproteobacteria bacterium]
MNQVTQLQARTDQPSRILVVDDDMAARLMARQALQRDGAEVVEAENGRQALELFEASKFDLVLLDVVMPDLDGFECCEALRALPGGAHVPILMMTGLDDVDSINRAYEVGATEFVTKPINYLLLGYRARYMLRSANTAIELRDSEARLVRAQHVAKLGHWEFDFDSRIFMCSPLCESLFEIESGVRLKSASQMLSQIHPEDRKRVAKLFRALFKDHRPFQGDYRVVMDDERVRYVQHEAMASRDASTGSIMINGVVQDVTQRRLAEEQAHQLTFFDSVTGLANRKGLSQRLERSLGQVTRMSPHIAVLAVDVDNFRRINDPLGHSVGDEVIRELARRLSDSLNNENIDFTATITEPFREATLARTGGDEFAVVLTGLSSPDGAAQVARRIRRLVAQPITISDAQLSLTASVGIAVYPLDGEDADTLMRQADAALNHAKGSGRDRYQFVSTEINQRAVERLSLESNLSQALELDQFAVYYQPKVASLSGELVGVEALVRWRHPDLGGVAPDIFIPIAEESGLIHPLGEWILNEACRTAAGWVAAGSKPIPVAVNLSATQFVAQHLDRQVREALSDSGMSPELLELELTESVLM